MSDLESLPGCLGLYEAPIPPNGPCHICPHRELCKRISINFVPRRVVEELIAKIEAAIKEG